jgi:hypothetical protein
MASGIVIQWNSWPTTYVLDHEKREEQRKSSCHLWNAIA